ncbi:MAG TPA: hypothetical protein VGD60_02145 [Candidatus Acidoferrales bacterium]
MKTLWCWRCKADFPMLEDEEYDQLKTLFNPGTTGAPKERAVNPGVFQEYRRITGLRGVNLHMIFDHRVSKYGEPCAKCGKPLRTPQARLCGACMTPVAALTCS